MVIQPRGVSETADEEQHYIGIWVSLTDENGSTTSGAAEDVLDVVLCFFLSDIVRESLQFC